MTEANETLINTEDSFAMVNLVPRMTGLPMTIWASPRNAPHDVRIKVSRVHGRRMTLDDSVEIALRPTPHLAAGQPLDRADMEAVSRWIALNEATLVAYWIFTIDTDEFLQRLQKLTPPILP
jgi:hypothetical protein